MLGSMPARRMSMFEEYAQGVPDEWTSNTLQSLQRRFKVMGMVAYRELQVMLVNTQEENKLM